MAMPIDKVYTYTLPLKGTQCGFCGAGVYVSRLAVVLGREPETIIVDSAFAGPVTETHDRYWGATAFSCPKCGKVNIHLASALGPIYENEFSLNIGQLVRPNAPSQAEVSEAVPADLAEDYREAQAVLPVSPKASAALSRRCLQRLLMYQGFEQRDLAKQIEAILESKQLPAYLAEAVDAIRAIGNFAAHPIKSQSTGEIVDVEPGEAEWNLDVLERLFEFFYVQPEILRKQRERLNAKLKDAGKPPLKGSDSFG